MTTLILVVIVLLLCSALCSGSEAALFVISSVKAREMAQNGEPGAEALLKIRQRMSRPISTIVILNNIVNIAGSVLAGMIAGAAFGDRWVAVFSAVLTFLVIVFAEIIPKKIATTHAEAIAPLVARPILALSVLFTPFVWIIEMMTSVFSKAESVSTSEAEIRLLASAGHQEGVIEKDESEMIHRVFELNDVTAGDIMTPRVVMSEARPDETLASCRERLCDSPHSRWVVNAGGIPEKITGIVMKNDLLAALLDPKNNQRRIAEFQNPISFVPENARADALLKLFRQKGCHLAVVVDEYGGIVGVVTLEDVLEVLTGQIVDETDQVTDMRDFARRRRQTANGGKAVDEGA